MITVDNIADFNKSLGKVMDLVEDGGAAVLKKVSFDTLRNLQKKTPRDTSRARAGWHTTVDQQPSEWKPSKDKKSYQVQQFKGGSRIRFDSLINLSNNVEYIVLLDKGSSRQATMGIINPVIVRAHVQLERILLKESNRKIK